MFRKLYWDRAIVADELVTFRGYGYTIRQVVIQLETTMIRVWMKLVVALVLLSPWNSGMTMDSQSLTEKVIGDWNWVYRTGLPIMQPGQEIQYRIRRDNNGDLTGTAWNGDTRLTHLRIMRVEISGDLIRFVHPARDHYYEGELSKDGSRIVGLERHHSQIDKMDLARVDSEL